MTENLDAVFTHADAVRAVLEFHTIADLAAKEYARRGYSRAYVEIQEDRARAFKDIADMLSDEDILAAVLRAADMREEREQDKRAHLDSLPEPQKIFQDDTEEA